MTLIKKTIDGLETYLDVVPGMKNLDVELIVKVGSVDEPDDLAGICHALEHCTHLQTPSFDGQPAIDSFADKHAFHRNAATYYTWTKYYAKGLEPEPMFQLVGELTAGARFDPERVAEEMKSVRREAKTLLDDIEDLDFAFHDYVLFGKPYGREILGYHDRLNFSAETLDEYYQKYYTLPNMALVIVGDITSTELSRLTRAYITKQVRTHQIERPVLPEPKRPYPSVKAFGFVREDSSNARLCLETAVPVTYIDADDECEWAYAAARRLISKAVIDDLRYSKGLSYDGFFSISSYSHRNACRFRAEVTVDIGDVEQASKALRAVLDRDPASYSNEDMEKALSKQRMDASQDVDEPLDRSGTYINKLSLGSPMISAEQSYEDSVKTTVEDVRRALEHTYTVWHEADVIECVTGPKAAVGERFVIEQSVFA